MIFCAFNRVTLALGWRMDNLEWWFSVETCRVLKIWADPRPIKSVSLGVWGIRGISKFKV